MRALRRGIILASAIVTLLAAATLASSSLETVSGETYSGRLSDNHILLESPWAGPLPIAVSFVAKVYTQPGRVELAGGDVLTGVIRNERFNFQADFAEIVVEPAKVKSLVLESARAEGRPEDVTVALENGDVVRGKLTVDESRRTAISLSTSYGGVVNVMLKAVASIKRVDPKAYEVQMRDGSKMSGEVLNASYVLTTEYAELVIPRTAVASFSFPK